MQLFSPIQNHILSKLKNAKSLRYSEMQMEGTPNDLYNYHLQFLVKKGFVDKIDDGYMLSESGIHHVADPYTVPGDPMITSLFKVNVITIVSRVRDGKLEILNQVRGSNPSYGKVGVMGGVVWKGELTLDAAPRKLEEETGLTAKFKLIGMERRIMHVDGKLFSDVLFPIAYADNYSGTLANTGFGENMWVGIDQAIKNESHPFDSIGSIKKVLELIRDGKIDSTPFFYTEDIKKGSFDK
ncbi:MAG TPA: NUDIX hydrolase [Candidatus Paceibacterota bacterium]